MKRRRFANVAAAAAAAALWPSFVRRAFGDDPACDGGALGRVAVVAAAFRHARAAGRALLVFVIPADDRAKWTRGQVFGELINHGSDRDLAPLAGVEVVCATMEDLRKLVPNAGVGDPLMVLVQPDRVPVTVRQLDVALPENAPFTEDSPRAHRRHEDEVSDQRIAAMGELLRRSLGIDERRAGTLAADVRARLKDKPPAGTRWANSRGCGVQIEGEPPAAIGCGMGSVPEKAQRFLYFFSKR